MASLSLTQTEYPKDSALQTDSITKCDETKQDEG